MKHLALISVTRKCNRATVKLVVLFLVGAHLSDGYSQPVEWKPGKNVEIIAGVTPGGGIDRTARMIQGILSKSIANTTLTVVNRPGGGGALAWAYLNQHVGDGNYLSAVPINLLTNRITGANPLAHTDVTPLAQVATEYVGFAVKADSPIKNSHDLVDQLKKDPESLSIAIAAVRGGAVHIAAGLVLKTAGVNIEKLKFVVFGSGGLAMTALLGGHVDAVSTVLSNIAPHLAAGRVRVLGVSSPQRVGGAFAEVPTWREQGVDAVFSNWRGVIGPRGMTQAQIAYWDKVFAKMVKTKEWEKYVESSLQVNDYMNSQEYKRFLDAQYEPLRSVLTQLGLAK